MLISVVCAFILGEEDNFLNLHTAFGYIVISMLIFRLIWGFAGPKYSRFKDFPIGIKSLKKFFSNMKAGKENFPGHNPAASLVMLGILATILCIGITGMLALASKGFGPLSMLNISESEIYKELHEAFVIVLIVLVSFHLLGILADRILHGNSGTLISMFTGFKNMEGESVKLNVSQKVISIIFILIAVLLFVTGATQQHFPKEEKTTGQEKKEIKLKQDDD